MLKLFLSCCFIVVSCFQYAKAQDILTLRLATEATEEDISVTAGNYFVNKVKEYSNGSIQIKFYIDGSLGNSKDIISGVRGGLIELAIVSTSNLGGLYTGFLALDLPYIFDSHEHAYKALNGDLAIVLNRGLDRANLVALSFLTTGYRNISTLKKPIYSANDVRNLKIRVPQTNALLLFFQELKANPVALSYRKLAKALDKGTVEAQEQTISAFYTGKFYKYQRYLALTKHAFNTNVIVYNKRKWNKLTKDQKQSLIKAAIDTREHIYANCRGLNQKYLTLLKKEGIIVNENVDINSFKIKADVLKNQYFNTYGDNILRYIERAKKELSNEKKDAN